MPLNRVTNLVNGNAVDAPELNSEFNNIVNALNATNPIDINIRINSPTVAPLSLNQQGAGPIAKFLQAGADKVTIQNTGILETISQFKSTVAIGTKPIDVVSTTLCTNLNADLIDGIDGADIARLSINKTAFSINFFEADPNATTFGTEDRASVIVPDGATMMITKLRICYVAGSHSLGATLSYIIRRHPNGSPADIDLGTVTLDNTNNAIRIAYTVDIADVALTSGDIITYYMSNRTGTINERAVTISAIGTQKLTT